MDAEVFSKMIWKQCFYLKLSVVALKLVLIYVAESTKKNSVHFVDCQNKLSSYAYDVARVWDWNNAMQ